eukprot:3285852-Pleurochrysis_carterae.AAC.1
MLDGFCRRRLTRLDVRSSKRSANARGLHAQCLGASRGAGQLLKANATLRCSWEPGSSQERVGAYGGHVAAYGSY